MVAPLIWFTTKMIYSSWNEKASVQHVDFFCIRCYISIAQLLDISFNECVDRFVCFTWPASAFTQAMQYGYMKNAPLDNHMQLVFALIVERYVIVVSGSVCVLSGSNCFLLLCMCVVTGEIWRAKVRLASLR